MIVRSIENHGDKSFLVLTYGDGRIVRSISGPQLTEMQCSAVTDAMKAMDDYVQKRLHEDGARLEYEGHVQIVDQDGGFAYDGITLHDAPFNSMSDGRGSHMILNLPRIDEGTDLGNILREMMGVNQHGVTAFSGRVVVEILDKNVEER